MTVAKTEGSVIFQFVAMLSGTLNMICTGMHYGWPSPYLPKLLHENSTIPITDDQGSWLAVMPLTGALCGTVIASLISNLIGRKKVIVISCFPFLAAWIMIACANTIVPIILARFIAGVSDGLMMNALPMYLGEIADPKVRGVLGTSIGVFWIFGIMLINAIGSYVDMHTTAAISTAFPVLCFLTFIWMPESPYYLIMKNNIEQAKKNLMVLKRRSDVEADIEVMMKAAKEQSENAGRVLDLFTIKSNRKALFITLGLRGVQQLSGMIAITFYAQTIFEEAGDSGGLSSSDAAIIYFSVQVCLCVFCSLIVDKAGRRPLLIVSIIGAGIALFVEGSYFLGLNVLKINLDGVTWIPLVALICFVVCFSLGMQTIPVLLLGEFFPTNLKSYALCVGDIYFTTIATIVSKFFQITKDKFGLHVPFYVFSSCCLLGLIFIIFFIPETKGKTLEEIQDELRGLKKEKDEEKEVQLDEKLKLSFEL